MSTVELKDVGEKYRLKFIKEGQISWEEIWALKGITLTINKGQTLGVIGQNGAGKTTLLKLIAGMLIADTGSVNVNGKISTIMELGAGFNPEFTGRENIVVNARVYGLDDSVLKQMMAEIIEFADLGKFIDAPIKYYSQGMYMRLAFALAIFINPDILLIDDILAVGDEEAQQKCVKKIFELKNQGKIIVVVSHDMNMISKLCDRVILLKDGSVIQDDSTEKVVPYYLETIGDKKGLAILENQGLRVVFNNGRITINYNGNPITKGRDSCVYIYQDNLNIWLPSFNLDWKIIKSLTNKIIAEGVNPQGELVQVWTIQISDDQIKWQAEIKDKTTKNSNISLFLVCEYKEWVDLYAQKAFPGFAHKTNWQEIGLERRSGVTLGITAERFDIRPALLITTDALESQLKLFNSGYEQEARVIQIHSSNDVIPISIKLYSQVEQLHGHIQEEKQKLLLQEEQEHTRAVERCTISSGDVRVFADVENKAIRIFYKDKEITRGNGLHCSFLFNKSWQNTSLCEWQVSKDDNALLVSFFWLEQKFVQTWKLRFNEKTLEWDNKSEVNQEFGPEALKFGICVCSDYRKFFCGGQAQDFPEEFSYWQDMPLKNQNARLLGLTKQTGLPALALENKNSLSCLIQNSDAQAHFRILQLVAPQELLAKKIIRFSSQLFFLEEETFIEDYIRQEKQKLLLQEEQEHARALERCTISSGNLRVFADGENKAIRIFYKDKEVTRGEGLHCSFKISSEPTWGFLKYAQWTIQKSSEQELVLKAAYPFFLQTWKCICKDNNTLEFIIELEVDKPIALANHDVRVELQDTYKRWLTINESGDFLPNQYVNSIGPIRLKNSKVTKVILNPGGKNPEGKEDISGLLFEAKFPADKQILGIYKYRYPHGDSACLNFSLIIPKKKEYLDSGKYTYFIGKIILDNKTKLEDETILTKGVELKNNSLRFLFERGIGKLFFGKKELTTGLGLYTSIRSSGIWHDSSQAVWEIISKTNNKIATSGNWPYIPISQYWQLELLDENSILWTIDMDVHDETCFEIEQTNLMLSAEYKFWHIAAVNKGEFLDEYTEDYDILPFRFWYGKLQKEGMGATATALPMILFRCALENELIRMIVENTDCLYKARLLQYQKCNTYKLPPQRHHYFTGVIKIETEK